VAALGTSALHAAQNFPTKPVRLIAPYAAGGASDRVARVVAQKFSDRYGQQFVVDNRAGAGGILGNIAPLAISPAMQANLGFDPLKDFAPISLLATGPTVLVVNPAIPAKSVKELIARAKAQPRKLNYGTGAICTALAPDLPTVAEAGLPGIASDTWWFLLAPARTPAAVINQLNAETRRVLLLPDVKERFADLGIDGAASSPAEFSAFLKAELEKFVKLIRVTVIRAE